MAQLHQGMWQPGNPLGGPGKSLTEMDRRGAWRCPGHPGSAWAGTQALKQRVVANTSWHTKHRFYNNITTPDLNTGFLLNQRLFPPRSPLPPRCGQKRSPSPRPQLNSGDPWSTGRWAGAGVPHARPQGPSQAGSCGGGQLNPGS